MKRRLVLGGAVLLALPTPAMASDFGALAPALFAVLAIVTAFVFGTAYLLTMSIKASWLRQMGRALALTMTIGPVIQGGTDVWGQPYSEMQPMLWLLLFDGFYGDWAGAILTPLGFFSVAWVVLILLSKEREAQRLAREQERANG